MQEVLSQMSKGILEIKKMKPSETELEEILNAIMSSPNNLNSIHLEEVTMDECYWKAFWKFLEEF
jgi:hypothetical protein